MAVLRAEVNAGASFARALAQHPREFSDIYCAVIGAGEHSGKLGLVLESLADDLEERQALKAKLVGAALYPAIVTVVSGDALAGQAGRAGGGRVCRLAPCPALFDGGNAGHQQRGAQLRVVDADCYSYWSYLRPSGLR